MGGRTRITRGWRETLPNVAYERIVAGGIEVRMPDEALRTIAADTVVIAAGQERNDALLEPIRTLGVPFRVIGGAREASELNAVRAFEDGLRAAHELARDLSLAPQLRRKPSDGNVKAGNVTASCPIVFAASLTFPAIKISVPTCFEVSFPQAPALIAHPLA